jgi:hypothetical protein
MKNTSKYGHWTTFKDFDQKDYFGFIYIITNNINGRKYIGKRNFVINNKRGYGASDKIGWKRYVGSQKDLIKDIKLLGKENFKFTIVDLQDNICDDIKSLSQLLLDKEIKLQIQYNVLKEKLPNGSKAFYNRNIHNIGFDSTGKVVSSDTIAKVKLTKSLNPKSNPPPHNKDTRIYKFKNLVTDEVFEGTKYEFQTFSNMAIGMVHNITSSVQKQSHNWALNDTEFPIYCATNVITKETITGTFYKLKSHCNIGNSVYDLIKCKEWVLSDYTKIRVGSDRTIYTFKNILTEEIFTGTRCEFRHAKNLSYANVYHIVKKIQLTSKNWMLVSAS